MYNLWWYTYILHMPQIYNWLICSTNLSTTRLVKHAFSCSISFGLQDCEWNIIDKNRTNVTRRNDVPKIKIHSSSHSSIWTKINLFANRDAIRTLDMIIDWIMKRLKTVAMSTESDVILVGNECKLQECCHLG